MKIYFHMNLESFSNCYLIVNEQNRQAIIIDPGKITKELIDQIENGGYSLNAILITHNHPAHTRGISTLKKIYDAKIYGADTGFSTDEKNNIIHSDGRFDEAGLIIEYFSVPGHSSDSIVYKIGNVLFTGDVIFAGTIGSSTSSYSKLLLENGIKSKIFSQPEDTMIMPGHGPITSVGAERMYNIDMEEKKSPV